MPTETELKLRLLNPADSALLAQHPACIDTPPTAPRRLLSTYFDTPKLNLLNMGIGLRVRDDNGRLIQTVKTTGSSVSGLHQRQEWESEIQQQAPVYALLPEFIRRQKISDPRLMERVTACFVTDFTRTDWHLNYQGSEIELSLDQGEIRANQTVIPLHEIELELKQGEAKHLYTLALELQSHMPLVIENVSKAHRGYALIRPPKHKVRTAGDIKLTLDMNAEAAMEAILWHSLAHLQANHASTLAGNKPEGVHQMRVALRRLRTCISLYKPLLAGSAIQLDILKDINWINGILGEARDWDVLDETLILASAQASHAELLKPTRDSLRQLRHSAYTALREALSSVRYHRLLLTIGHWLMQREWRQNLDQHAQEILPMPAELYAAQVLRRQHRRLRKHGKKLLKLTPAARHQVRIESKKLAYGARFFRALFPHARQQKAAAHYINTLSDLRDQLGHLNDVAVAKDYLNRLNLTVDSPAYYFLQGWFAAQEAFALQLLPDTWDSLRCQSPFWGSQGTTSS
jgi:inorganic triphosphatase YgiF